MATDLGSTSLAFTSSNMKPESPNQIDALWGQNIADNTSASNYNHCDRKLGTAIIGPMQYFNYRDRVASVGNPFSTEIPSYFFKDPNFTNLRGTYDYIMVSETNIDVNGTLLLLANAGVDGTLVEIKDSASGPASVTGDGNVNFDISGFTDGELVKLSFLFDDNSTIGAEERSEFRFNFNLFCMDG